ncbi:MAG: GNAT family N-acetyltransferase [Planctomycetota bacterium]
MSDMLVKLLELPPLPSVDGVIIRRARAYERSAVRRFVERFGGGWADEVDTGFVHVPPGVFIATTGGTHGGKTAQIVGFAAFDCTARGFFGPTAVDESQRGKGVGKALLIATLHAMREAGYVYAIIGGVGPAEFYERAVGATVIDDGPGLYTDLLAP